MKKQKQKQKHTPGPWQVHGSHIYTADPERALLAQALNPGNKASEYPLSANARLIAAAPAMYELLSDIMDELRRACRDAIDTGNREGSSLPASLERRIYEAIEGVKK